MSKIDLRRCIRLLELIPEWLPRLQEMVKYDAPETKPQGIVIGGSGISAYDIVGPSRYP